MTDTEHDSTVKLEIEILQSLWDRMRTLFKERGWEDQDGLRLVVAAGIASLEADEMEQAIKLGDDPTSLLGELARLDSEYSAMKYRAFKLAEANRALQLKVSALKASEEAWHRWAKAMRLDPSSKPDMADRSTP